MIHDIRTFYILMSLYDLSVTITEGSRDLNIIVSILPCRLKISNFVINVIPDYFLLFCRRN